MLKLRGFAAEDLNGFLDEGTELQGELRFRDVLRVDGRVRGRIVSDNTLIIGETGQVDAEIDCGVVSIRGRVSGQVHGRQRIELLAGCRVQATLVSPKLVIEDGAFFQGECRMGAPPETAPPRPRPGEEEAAPGLE
jgi:cytoskeletal protein CcmA (bactofilin family)